MIYIIIELKKKNKLGGNLMAQISFNDVQDTVSNNTYSGQGPQVGYFSLKNDGDEAIVRIAYDNTSEFNILSTHMVKVVNNGNVFNRKVSCLRTPKDPIENCPLCGANIKSTMSFYIPMIQYIIDERNQVTYRHVMWERSMTYATKIKALIDEYGPLKDCVFKIKRYGAAGSRDTTYEIMYGNPKMYPDEVFVKDFSAFDNFKVLGTMVMDKDYNEMQHYLQNGTFPQKQREQQNNTPVNVSISANDEPQFVPKGTYATPQTPIPQGVDTGNAQFVSAQQHVSAPQHQVTIQTQSAPTVQTPVYTSAPAVPVYTQAPQVPTNEGGIGAPPKRATRYY